jgi:hypothetical protein
MWLGLMEKRARYLPLGPLLSSFCLPCSLRSMAMGLQLCDWGILRSHCLFLFLCRLLSAAGRGAPSIPQNWEPLRHFDSSMYRVATLLVRNCRRRGGASNSDFWPLATGSDRAIRPLGLAAWNLGHGRMEPHEECRVKCVQFHDSPSPL